MYSLSSLSLRLRRRLRRRLHRREREERGEHVLFSIA
jgi:hypothetical protein